MPRADTADWIVRHQAAELAREQLRKVDGKDYTEHLPEVDALIKRGDLDEAAGLLLRLVEAVEREAAVPLAGHPGIAPAYHRRLASVYRKLKRPDLAAKVDLRFEHVNAQAAAESNRLLLLQRGTSRTAEPGTAAPRVTLQPRGSPPPKQAAINAGRLAGTAVRGLWQLGKALTKQARKR